MLQMTPGAIAAFKHLLEEKGKQGHTIRIFTMGSGCCGPTVGMDMVEGPQPGDLTLEQDGLLVCLEAKAAAALDGMTIDFSSAGPKKGFLIQNPAAGSCCV
ncbi:MAG TPA: iron-sulfur cluster assembly accessory protein [Holophaga sp.]|nr:iron-sulfur cluster assembly accessory protein [Holophaga sp.]